MKIRKSKQVIPDKTVQKNFENHYPNKYNSCRIFRVNLEMTYKTIDFSAFGGGKYEIMDEMKATGRDGIGKCEFKYNSPVVNKHYSRITLK